MTHGPNRIIYGLSQNLMAWPYPYDIATWRRGTDHIKSAPDVLIMSRFSPNLTCRSYLAYVWFWLGDHVHIKCEPDVGIISRWHWSLNSRTHPDDVPTWCPNHDQIKSKPDILIMYRRHHNLRSKSWSDKAQTVWKASQPDDYIMIPICCPGHGWLGLNLTTKSYQIKSEPDVLIISILSLTESVLSLISPNLTSGSCPG